MIEKERLEELIEQGATIYSTDTKMYGLVKWLELENKLERLEFNKDGEVKLFIIDNGWWHWFNLKDLYEDLEDVKWHKEFGCIERTERLELPTWEEISRDLKDVPAGTYVIKEFDDVSLEYIKYNEVFIGIYKGDYEWKEWEATKENYTLACRKAKELFLGKQEVNG